MWMLQGSIDSVRVHDRIDTRRQQNEGAYSALAHAVIIEWMHLDRTLSHLKHGQGQREISSTTEMTPGT